MSRRREPLSPTMFPFLAVLICTLGTLILMLALLAHGSGKASAASDAPEYPAVDDVAMQEMIEADAEIERRLGEARWHREHVVQMRDEQTAELDERRLRQAHLEDHLRRLRDELIRLQTEVNSAVEKTENAGLSQAAIESVKAKIENEKAKIEKLKSEQLTKQPRIVIVPHKGPNGTDRRPVYIECRADGVYLQPEGVAIDAKYLESETSSANPLDAALRTIRLHAMKNYGDSVAPYPLIVVRPDGIETYGAVRVAMNGWDDQYGYELVPDDVKLAYSEPDPLLKERVELAIAQAVSEQQAMIQYGQGRGRGGRGSSSGSDSSSGSSSRRSSRSDSGVTGNESSGGDDAPQSNPQGALAQATRGTPTKRSSDFPVLSVRGLESKALDAAENGYRNSGSGHVNRTPLPSQRTAITAASPVTDTSTAKLDGQAAQLANSPDRRKINDAKSKYSGLNNSGDPGDLLGEDDNTDSSTTADKFASPSTVASRSRVPSASTDPNAPIGGSQSMGSQSANNPAGTAPQPLGDSSSEAAKNSSPPSQPSVTIDANSKTPPKSLVKRGDRDWALPRDVAASVGTKMVRAIRVECYRDRLVLLPEGGRGAINVYGFSDGDINRASLELATEVRDRVERWGAGMPGGRWHPLLSVTVAPGGEARFQQLQRLLDGSGIELESKGDEQ